MNQKLRNATIDDVPQLEVLIPTSARRLQATDYTRDQIEAALGSIFAVDRQLIHDQTFFVTEIENTISGCGGWSKRLSLFGGDAERQAIDRLLNPAHESARIRAFFVHPDFARQGIGRMIIEKCESEIIKAGFKKIEIVATLAGVRLYEQFGYDAMEDFDIEMQAGLRLPVVRMEKSPVAP